MLVEAHLLYVRNSQGLCRYEEVEVTGQPRLVGVLYLSKARLGAKPPKGIRVLVEAVQEEGS